KNTMEINDLIKLAGPLLAGSSKKDEKSSGLDVTSLLGAVAGGGEGGIDTASLMGLLGGLSGTDATKGSKKSSAGTLDLGALASMLGGSGDLGDIAGLAASLLGGGATAAAADTKKSSSKKSSNDALKSGATMLAVMAALWAGKGLLSGDKSAKKAAASAKTEAQPASSTISVEDLTKLLQGNATDDGGIDLDGLMAALGNTKATATETKKAAAKPAVDLSDGIGLDDVVGMLGSTGGDKGGMDLGDVAGLAAGLLGGSGSKPSGAKKGGVDLSDGIGLDDVLNLLG
ncbi:MAG: hypothetical protein IKV55_03425, partial [Oscillospiraceae bacterium]|nr:hypothetical protein [Oscillospiraceae bacterium]